MSSTNWNLSPFESFTLPASTAAAVGTFRPSFGGGTCKGALVTIRNLAGGETIGITLSGDGTNFGGAVKPYDVTTNALFASAALANGQYWVNFPFAHMKFTKSAAVGSVDINVLATY